MRVHLKIRPFEVHNMRKNARECITLVTNFHGRGVVNLFPRLAAVADLLTFHNVDTPVRVSAGSSLPEICLPA